MSNSFADIVLYSWPIVVYILFQRLPLRDALVWSIVAGYLLLPMRTGFNLPAFPTVDKRLIPVAMAAVMCLVINRHNRMANEMAAKRVIRGSLSRAVLPKPIHFEPRRGQILFWGLLLFLFGAPFITALQNSDAIVQGRLFIPGLSLYDALSMNANIAVAVLPFLLGRRYLASDDAHLVLLRVFVIAAVGYSLLVLYEVRMSPQLNRQIYGFFPHSFSQHVRGDGFRPVVFMQHGLWLAIILCMSILAAAALWKATSKSSPNRTVWLLATLWLFGTLFLSKSLGAFALSLIFLPALLFLKTRMLSLVAMCFCGFVLLFPLVRSAGIVPVETILNIASAIDEQRAQSFEFRIENEDILLEKAMQKPIAGWGSWGRGRVYNEAGFDISTTDGFWVLILGQFGWLGYLAHFGLLCLPVIMLGLKRNKIEYSIATSGLALVLVVGVIDLIPNATINPILWLIAGAMMGRYQTARSAEASSANRKASQPILPVREPSFAGATQRTTGARLHKRRPR